MASRRSPSPSPSSVSPQLHRPRFGSGDVMPLAGRSTRTPLCELPVANFLTRPSSPQKPFGSPSKNSKLMASPVSLRALGPFFTPAGGRASGHGSPFGDVKTLSRISSPGSSSSSPSSSTTSSRASSSCNSAVALRSAAVAPLFAGADVRHSPLADLPLEQSPAIDRARRDDKSRRQSDDGGGTAASSAQTPRPPTQSMIARIAVEQQRQGKCLSRNVQGGTVVTPPLTASEEETQTRLGMALQSLPRKKDRVRRSAEVAHLLLDHDEDGTVDLGSPSPHKVRNATQTPGDDMLGSVEPSHSTRPIGLGISQPPDRAAAPIAVASSTWTVLVDHDDDEQDVQEGANDVSPLCAVEQTVESVAASDIRDEEKENAKPDPVVLQGRRRGTGGRLSLVAMAEQAEESAVEDISIGAVPPPHTRSEDAERRPNA